MQFPAYCTDKDTGGLVYVPSKKKYSGSQHIYVTPIELETLEHIKETATSDFDVFMGLKAKGWLHLNKAERELFQALKLKVGQVTESA